MQTHGTKLEASTELVHELARALASSCAELEVVRRSLADRSEQLAAAQTETYHLRRGAARLSTALDRISALENELNAMRYRSTSAEAALSRLKRSFSWRVTRPLRWIGRVFNKHFTGS